MINDIIDAISVRLDGEFGNEYNIYKEKVEQGFKIPSFYIKCLEHSRKKISIGRYYSINHFDIHYFSGTQNINDDNYSVADRISSVMEQIALLNGDIALGSNMSHHLEDGVLHFLVNFNVTLKNVETEQDMMEIIKTTVKET